MQKEASKGGEEFGGNIKQSPFQPTNETALSMSACLGLSQLPTLNLGIPSQCPHYKIRVRNKISGGKAYHLKQLIEDTARWPAGPPNPWSPSMRLLVWERIPHSGEAS